MIKELLTDFNVTDQLDLWLLACFSYATLSDNQKNRIYKRNSLKIPTSSKPVADTISFLLSEEAESITGQNINLD